MEIKIFSCIDNKFENFRLNSKIWSSEFSPRLISLYNRYTLSNKRNTISKTKTKGEVSGGGRKPWRQKGTGRARQGSIRSPQWKGGGVVFGPTGEQNYSIRINKKERKLALASLLSERASKNEIIILDGFSIDEYKTKEAISILEKLKVLDKNVLFIFSYPNEFNEKIVRSFRNISKVQLTSPLQVNASKILSSHVLIFTKESISQTESLLS